jgi:hypothetical protein
VLALAVILATIFQTVGSYVGGRLVEVASKKMDFLLGNDSFAKALYMKLEYKPESTGFFVGQLQMYQQFREFFSGLTMTILIDLPFSIIFVIITFIVAGQLALVPLLAILISLVLLTAIQIPLNRVIKELNNTGFAAAGEPVLAVAYIVSPKKPNILRTIYMPNFEVDQGREQVQKLRDEIDSDKVYYEDILKCLQEEKAQFEE